MSSVFIWFAVIPSIFFIFRVVFLWLLLMAEIRRAPAEVGSLSHYLQGFSTIPGCLSYLLLKFLRIFRHQNSVGFWSLGLKSLNIGQTGRPVHALQKTSAPKKRASGRNDLSQFKTRRLTRFCWDDSSRNWEPGPVLSFHLFFLSFRGKNCCKNLIQTELLFCRGDAQNAKQNFWDEVGLRLW